MGVISTNGGTEINLAADSSATKVVLGKGNSTTLQVFLPGQVTASGNISASGTTGTHTLGGDLTLGRHLTIGGDISNVDTTHITASGNISSSGDITLGGDITLDGNIYLELDSALSAMTTGGSQRTIIKRDTDNNVVVGSVHASGIILDNDTKVTGHITASGNISASGTIVGSNLSGTNTGDQDLSTYIQNSQTGSFLVGSDTGSFVVNSQTGSFLTTVDISSDTNLVGGTNITLAGDTLNVDDAFLKNDADDTTSGVITAGGFTTSGDLVLNGPGTGHYISASQGNIELSGSGTALFEVVGNISASGTITANIFEGMISSSTQIKDDISGSFVELSSSISSTYSEDHAVLLGNTIVSSSAQIADDISGSFIELSSSISSTYSEDHAVLLGNTIVSSSTQIADDISGSWENGITTNIIYETSSISSTGNVQGDIVKFGNTTTVVGAIYAHTGSGWTLAGSGSNSNASSSLGFAVGTNSTTHGMLLRGMANIGYDPGGLNGCALYLESLGSASNVVPTATGDVARVVGWNYGSDTIYFNPDNTWVEVS
jgi:hypothetical protein